ncbi:MAG: head GIN domain-containing protein [Ferruginibacter sp.]
MKQILLFIASFFMLISCRYKSGSGILVKEERNVSSFESVSAAGPFEVTLLQGDAQKVTVESDDNLIRYVETDVSGHTLKIKLRKAFSFRNGHFKVFITAPQYSSIQASASANIESDGLLKSADAISVKSSSAGDITLELDAPSVELDASSGAQINSKGRTRKLSAEASSGATVDAKNLLSENTQASSSSGATINVHASVSLNASASSGGAVHYNGGATDVRKKESSGGSVNKD